MVRCLAAALMIGLVATLAVAADTDSPAAVAPKDTAVPKEVKETKPVKSPYAAWKHGPPASPNFFPIGVWCQSPRNAEKYKAIGINFYLGLWEGPTEEQLAELKKAGMPVICSQNAVGLKYINDPLIIGWMHGDEPDNQKQVEGKYVPVAKPNEILADYVKWRKADPSRPVLLNLGCGVANDAYKGKWVPDHATYKEFLKGCDIVSFDIYPASETARPEVKGQLHLPAFGVSRLQEWGENKKVVWCIFECTSVSKPNPRPTPTQVRSEIWMALIKGATGVVYFCHEFGQGGGGEAALLKDQEMAQAVGEINQQILSLAPVLNAPTLAGAALTVSSNEAVPVEVLVKKHERATYVFAAATRQGDTTATITVRGLTGKAEVEVLGENRKVPVVDGKFIDDFKGYGVHLYRLVGAR
jgi:hypothetical protein